MSFDFVRVLNSSQNTDKKKIQKAKYVRRETDAGVGARWQTMFENTARRKVEPKQR